MLGVEFQSFFAAEHFPGSGIGSFSCQLRVKSPWLLPLATPTAPPGCGLSLLNGTFGDPKHREFLSRSVVPLLWITSTNSEYILRRETVHSFYRFNRFNRFNQHLCCSIGLDHPRSIFHFLIYPHPQICGLVSESFHPDIRWSIFPLVGLRLKSFHLPGTRVDMFRSFPVFWYCCLKLQWLQCLIPTKTLPRVSWGWINTYHTWFFICADEHPLLYTNTIQYHPIPSMIMTNKQQYQYNPI